MIKPEKNLPKEPDQPALLVGRLDAARICGVSVTAWDRLKAGALIPPHIKLGGRILWKRTDLEKWVDLGCPDKKNFKILTLDQRHDA